MKKWLLVLGMITCMLGASACSKQETPAETEETNVMTSEQASGYSKQLLAQIHELVLQGAQPEMFEEQNIAGAISSWQAALKEIGNFDNIYEIVLEDTVTTTNGKDGTTIDYQVKGSVRNAKIQMVIGKDNQFQSFSASPVYSMGELMQKAGLNTLLGMGTVFVILILISLVISCFKFIPMWQAKRANAANEADHSKVQQAPVAAAVDKTISQIVEKEELTDDTELVAVIAAAIAASEGHTSVDGFVVRSIRRVRRA